MKTYRVTAERAPDRWWVIDVPEFRGAHSQARRLDQVEYMARDLIAAMLDVDPESFAIEIDPILDPDTAAVLAAARSSRQRAEESQRAASEATRSAVTRLLECGLTIRDAGTLLGVAHQRVAQLAHQRQR